MIRQRDIFVLEPLVYNQFSFEKSFYTLSGKQNAQLCSIRKEIAFTSGRADRRNLPHKASLRVTQETHTFEVQNETGENHY